MAAQVKSQFKLPPYAAPILFILTTLIFFWDVLTGSGFFWEDIVRFVYPLQNYAAVSHGVPFWNPFSFSGMPFLGDLQVGFFYPLNRLLDCFTGSGTLSFSALEMVIILHFFIAQLNFYYLMRNFKISNFGSIIGAIGYSFSLIMVCHSIHPMIIAHLAWFPLVAMLFINGIKKRDLKQGIIAGLIYGMSMLSGHTQMALYEALVLFIIFLWYFLTGLHDKKYSAKNVWTPIVSSALTIAIAAGIFMMQYLPSSELVKYSKRSDSSYEFVTQGSLEMRQALTAFVPKIFGSVNGNNDSKVPYYLEGQQTYNYWETSFYCGISIFALALFGFIFGIKKRDIQLMLGLGLFCFLFALGKNFFIFDIFYNLPFFGLFRNPGRMMFASVFAFSVAAGFGFDALLEAVKSAGNSKKLYIAFGSVVLIALLAGFGAFASACGTPEEVVSDVNSYGMLAVLFSILTFGVCVSYSKVKYNPLIAGIVMTLVVFFDLYSAGSDFNKSIQNPHEQYAGMFEKSPQLKKLLTPKFPGNVFRVKMRLYDANGRTLAKPMEDNQGLIDRICLVEGYNPLLLDRMIPPIYPESKINDMRNVRYALEIDSNARQLAFLEHKTAWGNAKLFYNYKVISTDALKNAAKSKNYSVMGGTDFDNMLILEQNPTQTYSHKQSDSVAGANVKTLKYEENEIAYSAVTPENALMFFSETYYPEWKAYVYGKEVPILAANYSFRAIELPQGSHKVEMRFDGSALNRGRTIAWSTISVSILLVIALYFAGKRRKPTEPQA